MASPRSAVITGDPASQGPEIILEDAYLLQERVAQRGFCPEALGFAMARTAGATGFALLDSLGSTDAAVASAGPDPQAAAKMGRDRSGPPGQTILTTAGKAAT